MSDAGANEQHVRLQGALMSAILADLARGEPGVTPATYALFGVTMPGTREVAWTLHGFAITVAIPLRIAILNGSVRDYPFFDPELGLTQLPPGCDDVVYGIANALVVHAANGRLGDLRTAITNIVNGQRRDADGGVDGSYFCNVVVALVVISSLLMNAGCEWPEPSDELTERLWPR